MLRWHSGSSRGVGGAITLRQNHPLYRDPLRGVRLNRTVQLIIAGFHRSGTSLLTQLLHRAGLFVGDELLGAMPSNPYGHFEDVEVLRIHQEILTPHGADWQWDAAFPHYIGEDHWRAMVQLARRRNLAHTDWGFKDPRVCLLLGAWKYVLPDAKVVVVYRDPGESVRSLEQRQADDKFEKRAGQYPSHLRTYSQPDHGLRLWDTYNRALVSFVRAHRDDCLVIPHEALTQGYPVVRRINERFGAALTDVDTAEVYDPNVTRQRVAPQRYFSDTVAERVARTWADLESLTDVAERVE